MAKVKKPAEFGCDGKCTMDPLVFGGAHLNFLSSFTPQIIVGTQGICTYLYIPKCTSILYGLDFLRMVEPGKKKLFSTCSVYLQSPRQTIIISLMTLYKVVDQNLELKLRLRIYLVESKIKLNSKSQPFVSRWVHKVLM